LTDVFTSASDLEGFERCNRSRWFKKVLKLPEPTKGSRTFGVVLHSVLQRYLQADDVGRGVDGRPIDLYPPNWDVAVTKAQDSAGVSQTFHDRLDPYQQGLLQQLVRSAIEQGHVARRPGRRVEHAFGRVWIGQAAVVLGQLGDTRVCLSGSIDLLEPGAVTDWKSTKSIRYAASPNDLRRSPQMNIYAMVGRVEAEARGEPWPSRTVLRHVVFVKDLSKPKVRPTSVEVGRDAVEGRWLELRAAALRLAEQRRLTRWQDVPAPPVGSHACAAFGGCPFLGICSGHLEPTEYRRQCLNSLALSGHHSPDVPAGAPPDRAHIQGGTMSLLNDRAQPAPPAGGVAPLMPPVGPPPGLPPVDPPPVAVAPAAPAAPAAPPAGPSSVPPWAVPTCIACKGVGLNSLGAPCRICDVQRKKLQQYGSEAYDIFPSPGRTAWRANTLYAAALGQFGMSLEGYAELATPAATVAAPERIAPVPAPVTPSPAAPLPIATPVNTAATPVPTQEVSATTAIFPGSDETDAPSAAPAESDSHAGIPWGIVKGVKTTGRQTRGFTLVFNALPSRGFNPGDAIHLDQVLQRFGDHFCRQLGGDNWYALNAFQRRDVFAQAAPKLAEMFGKDFVFVPAVRSPDMDAAVAALQPYATRIIS